MKGIGSVLSSPIVLAGGAAIGLILLITKAPATASNVGLSPAVISGTVAMNTAALGSQVELAAINADVAQHNQQYDLARAANMLSFLKGIDDNARVLAAQRIQSQTGITQNLIQSSTMITIDQQQNINRLAMAQVETIQERIRANAQTEVARYQYKGAKAAAEASMLGSVIGGVTNIAKAFAV